MPSHFLNHCLRIVNCPPGTHLSEIWKNFRPRKLIRKSPLQYGDLSIWRCLLTSTGITILKIRQSHDRLIFIMEIPKPGYTVFILRRGPDSHFGVPMCYCFNYVAIHANQKQISWRWNVSIYWANCNNLLRATLSLIITEFHFGSQTPKINCHVVILSHLYNGNPCTCKTTSCIKTASRPLQPNETFSFTYTGNKSTVRKRSCVFRHHMFIRPIVNSLDKTWHILKLKFNISE